MYYTDTMKIKMYSCTPVNLQIYKNGVMGEKPVLVHVPFEKKLSMKTVMQCIGERLTLTGTGFPNTLYTMEGEVVMNPHLLVNNNDYVVAGVYDKCFKQMCYGYKLTPLLVAGNHSHHIKNLEMLCRPYDYFQRRKYLLQDPIKMYTTPEIKKNGLGPTEVAQISGVSRECEILCHSAKIENYMEFEDAMQEETEEISVTPQPEVKPPQQISERDDCPSIIERLQKIAESNKTNASANNDANSHPHSCPPIPLCYCSGDKWGSASQPPEEDHTNDWLQLQNAIIDQMKRHEQVMRDFLNAHTQQTEDRTRMSSSGANEDSTRTLFALGVKEDSTRTSLDEKTYRAQSTETTLRDLLETQLVESQSDDLVSMPPPAPRKKVNAQSQTRPDSKERLTVCGLPAAETSNDAFCITTVFCPGMLPVDPAAVGTTPKHLQQHRQCVDPPLTGQRGTCNDLKKKTRKKPRGPDC